MRAPGPVLSEQRAAVSETLRPPHESLSGSERLERVQWRCMLVFLLDVVGEVFILGRENKKKKREKEKWPLSRDERIS